LDKEEAQRLPDARVERRRARDFEAADNIRQRLRDGGWEAVDSAAGSELQAIRAQTAATSTPPARAVTLLTVVHGWLPDVERWLLSVFTHTKGDFEAVVVDNSGDPRIAGALARRVAERLRVLSLDPALGWAAAANAGVEAAAGQVVILLDPGVELTGDAAAVLVKALDDPTVVVAGPFGLRGKGTMKEFEESAGPDVDAVEGYCMAFRRADALAIGAFDPKFRFYRMADVELSFRLRDRGGRAVVVAAPVDRHEHRLWETTAPAERDRLSRRNMYRFLDRWREREDLLVGQ